MTPRFNPKLSKTALIIILSVVICVTIGFGCLYAYYRNIRNTHLEIADSYQPVTNKDRVDDYIEHYQELYHPTIDTQIPEWNEILGAYLFKLPESLVRSKSMHVKLLPANDERVAAEYPYYFKVWIRYPRGVPQDTGGTLRYEMMAYLLKPLYPKVTVEQIVHGVNNDITDPDRIPIYDYNATVKEMTLEFSFYVQ